MTSPINQARHNIPDAAIDRMTRRFFANAFDCIKHRLSDAALMVGGEPNLFDLILKHGEPWLSRPGASVDLKLPEFCFSNVQDLIAERPELGLVYCEGFAIRSGYNAPTHHAWAVSPAFYAVDPTWGHINQAVYFGVTFSRRAFAHWAQVPFLRSGSLFKTGHGLSTALLQHLVAYGTTEPIG